MKQGDFEILISMVLIATLIIGLSSYSGLNLNTPTGYTIKESICKPLSQKCGLNNIRYECNSQGEWYRSDCPSTDYCTEISLATAECIQKT